MIDRLKWFIEKWCEVMLRPILFFTRLKEESWQEEALTFLLILSWLTAFLATLVVFIISYVPVGQYMVAGIAGFKFIIILPVLIVLAFNFFAITFLILAGVFVCGFFVAQGLFAAILHYIAVNWQGKGSLNRMLQSMFYGSAPYMAVNIVLLLVLFAKYTNLGFDLFSVGFNLIYYLTVLFIYGLWAIAIRKNYGLPKWKAFILALVPILGLLLFGILFDKIALSKFEPWVS
ncbi:MAG: YIP1 family protein [Candidatus Margulisbacteria bacterium]|nr:YIP1 family protein [Candidatus Margulisiibacteriota bacterium]